MTIEYNKEKDAIYNSYTKKVITGYCIKCGQNDIILVWLHNAWAGLCRNCFENTPKRELLTIVKKY